MNRACFSCLFLLSIAAGGQLRGQAETVSAVPVGSPPTNSPASAALKFVGSRSCGSSNCHGSVRPDRNEDRIRRNEFLVWFEQDPHAQAGETLHGEASRNIVARLSKGTSRGTSSPSRQANVVPAWENSLCLSCHNPRPDPSQQGPRFHADQGIGCESCHGPAEQWLSEHYRAAWKPQKRVANNGFVDTEDLATRALTCTKCHVGSSEAAVGHDLIAAGHPPLKFELAGYYERLPKHWRDERERRTSCDLEAKLWLAGQAAQQDASLALLESRARAAAERRGPWPELAEYDCYACHHQLRPADSWRAERGFRRDGANRVTLPWGTWAFALSDLTPEFGTLVDSLRTTIERRLVPDAAQVADSARAARSQLRLPGNWLAPETAGAPEAILDIVRRVLQDDQRAVRDWDQAVQLYLALAALEANARDARILRGAADTDPERQQRLAELRQRLLVPRDLRSPSQFSGDSKQPQSQRAALLSEFHSLADMPGK